MSVIDETRMKGLAARVRALMLHPRSEWEAIETEPATVRGLYTGYVMYLAAIPPLCAFVGALIFGYSGVAADLHPSPVGQAVAGIISYALSLGGVYLMGLIIEAAAPYFGGVKDRMAAMKVAAYFPTALWLAGVFLLIPQIAALSILGLYSLFLLWLGLPRLMKVGEDKALVFTAVIVLAAIVVQVIILSLVGAAGVSLLPASTATV